MVAMVKIPKLAALKMTPLPHQRQLAEKLTDQPGLVAHHGVGSGKSFSTINAAEHHELPLLAVVPASLRNNFKKEIQQSGFKRPHMVVSYEEAQKRLEDPEFKQFAENALVAFDEAQRGGRQESQRSKLLGAVPAKKKLFLTGTPMRNAPHEIAPMINAISPGALPKTQSEFDNKFLSPREVPVGFWGRLRGAKPGKEYTPTNLMDFETAIKDKVDYYDAVDRSEYPSHSESIVEVPMTGRQQAAYDFTMGRYPALAYKVRHGLPLNKQEQRNFRAFMSGPRQVSNHPGGFNTSATDDDAPKIRKAADEVYQRAQADPNYRGVTYSSFLDTGVRPLMRELDRRGIRYAVFTGEQDDAERKRIIEDYNSGKIQQLLVSGAGAEGLDLKGTRLMQVLEPHWQEELINQVKGRGIRYRSHAHLPEQDRHVEVQRFHSVPRPGFFGRMFGKTRGSEKSVDEYLYERAKRKQEITKPFLDIMRGHPAKTSEAQGWLIEIEMDEATKEAGFRDAAEYAKRVVNRYRESLGRLCNGPTCFQGARKIQDALSERGIESRRSIWAYPGTHAVTELPTGEALHYGKQNSKGDMGFSRVPSRFIPTLSVGGYSGVSVKGKRLLKPPAGPDKSGPTTPDLAVGTPAKTSAAGSTWMDFPENELPEYRLRLSRGQPAYTTRVSAERGQYRVGQAVDSPLGRLRISEVKSHGAGDPHPFDSELTPGQRRQIQGAFDVIRFEPIDKARTVTASAEPLPNTAPPAQPILTGENAHWHEWRPDASVKVPAFLFDLDDTLVTTPGSSYPKELGQQQVLPRRLEVLAQLHEKGYKLIGITNRSDYLGDTTLADVIASIKESVTLLGNLLDDVLFIPYYCDQLNKPSPLMIDTAVERYCLDRENCIYVGDNDDDREAAKNADVTYAHPNTFFDADFGLIPPASPRVVLDTPDGWEVDEDIDRRTFFFDDWRKSKDFITALCQEAMFRQVVPNTLNIGGSQVEVYLPRGNHGFCHWINALYDWGEFTAWGEDLVDDASWAANRKPRCFSSEMPETRHEVPAPKPAPASIRRAAEDRLSSGFFTVTDLDKHEPAPRRHHGRVQGFPRWQGII